MIPSKTFVFPNLLPLLVLLLDLLAFLDDRLRPRHTTTLRSHGPPHVAPYGLVVFAAAPGSAERTLSGS